MNLKLLGIYKWIIRILEENRIKMYDIYIYVLFVFLEGVLC